jgi:hypothetical protein
MTLVCPTDVVEAPIGVVRRLLTEPAGRGGFFDVRIAISSRLEAAAERAVALDRA